MEKSARVIGVMVLVAGVVGIGAYAAQARLASNRLIANRLTANRLSANRLAANRLTSNGLDVNGLGASDLLATADGRSVLSYLVTCALPADMTLEANQNSCVVDDDCKEHNQDGTVNNDNPTYTGSCNANVCHYSFPGNLGLAPEWLDQRLSKEGKGWISACLLARVNLHDTAEEISIRGAHPALAISPDEALIYTVEEGAFYGNVFTRDDEPLIEIACRGEGQGSGAGGLVTRECARPDPANPGFTKCGFTFAGDCRDFTPQFPSPFACERFGSFPPPHSDHGSFYSDCHDSPGLGTWPHSTVFHEVITIFVPQ